MIIILLWIEAFNKLKIDFAFELIGTVTAEKEKEKKDTLIIISIYIASNNSNKAKMQSIS